MLTSANPLTSCLPRWRDTSYLMSLPLPHDYTYTYLINGFEPCMGTFPTRYWATYVLTRSFTHKILISQGSIRRYTSVNPLLSLVMNLTIEISQPVNMMFLDQFIIYKMIFTNWTSPCPGWSRLIRSPRSTVVDPCRVYTRIFTKPLLRCCWTFLALLFVPKMDKSLSLLHPR
jgi:hypothetical protein